MPQRKPWLKWYWTDWRGDPRLRMCCLAARGLWAEMLALMQEAEPYGHLLVNGIAPTDTQLASLAGAPSDQIPDLVRELESAGVFSRSRNRVIYSRRMVRDEKRRKDGEIAAETGTLPTSRRGRQRAEKQSVFPPPSRMDSGAEDSPPSPQKPETRTKDRDANASPGDAELLRLDGPSRDATRLAFDAYNTLAAEIGLARATKLDARRRTAIGARLRDWGGTEGWMRMLGHLRAWRHGRGENDRNWKADLDFIVRPEKFTRLIEGGYGTAIEQPKPAGDSSHDPTWSPRLADFDRNIWHEEIWGPPPDHPEFRGPAHLRRARAA